MKSYKPISRASIFAMGLFGMLQLGACAPNVREVVSLDGGASSMMPPAERSCGQDADCDSDQRCVDSSCIADHGTCSTDQDCQDDTYCACPPDIKAAACACVPWGHKPRGTSDPLCQGQAFAPDAFKNPVLKCQWPSVGSDVSYKWVMSTPVVIDLENDGQSEVIFVAKKIGAPHLIAISGRDCAVKWDVPAPEIYSEIAAGDLDGDGKIEIVALTYNEVMVFDHEGTVKASVTRAAFCGGGAGCPPAIVNLDGAGPPEIVTGGEVFRFSAAPTPHLDPVWAAKASGGDWAVISIAEDLDGDGKSEVITGNQVFDGVTGANKTKTIMQGLSGGYPAIGDFNGDGHPDIVLITSATNRQQVQVIDYFNNAFIMPPTETPNGWGGAPTVADFDGDGRPEFATAGKAFYYVYSPDCLANPKPAKCHGIDPGVLWQSPVRDASSGATGSSVFDFNGDKRAEVVYRDECWLRVYNGSDGRKLFAAPITSGTVLELPVIADTDGDGHADIVVTSDDVQGDRCLSTADSATELGMPHGPSTSGVKIFTDPMNRWMPSRSIWNQHSYHITNINDDGTVPLRETSNVASYNSYRQNIQGATAGTADAGDATGRIVFSSDVGDCVKLFRVSGKVCNRGAAPLAAGLPATFYLGDPRLAGAKTVCTATTTKTIQVGACEQVVCDWIDPARGPSDLWFRVNDDGASHHPADECKNGNDLAHLAGAFCSMAPG